MSNNRKRINTSGGAQSAAPAQASNLGDPVSAFHVFCQAEYKADQGSTGNLVGRSEISNKTLAALAATSHKMGQLFQPVLNQRAAKQLLQHILKGEKDQAEAMIIAYPKLLRMIATAKDHAGRTIKATPLRAALGAKDVSIGAHEEMAEMTMRHMRTHLDDGEAEIERQKAAQFPEGWEQEEAARKQADTAALNQVFASLAASTTDEERDAAVAVFQVHLAQQKKRIIETAYHFNEQLFEEALALYNRHYDPFGGFDSPKNRAAAIKVIGGIERIFTANLAQAVCDGFDKVADKKAPLSRSLLLSYPKNYPFFHSDLGQSHFVYSYYSAGAPECAPWRLAPQLWSRRLSKHMSSKNSKLAKLMRQRRQATSFCAIM